MKKMLLLIPFFALSCNSEQDYTYIEKVEKKGLFSGVDIEEREPRAFKATTDSAAFVYAYRLYCIATKVYKDMKESGYDSPMPLDFKVRNADGVDLSDISFSNKESMMDSIKVSIFSRPNNVEPKVDFKEPELLVDKEKVASLKPFFKEELDEFSGNKTVWIFPKNAPRHINKNAIYCYFQTNNDVPSNFRLRVQYNAESWLFFNKVQFLISGEVYDYAPSIGTKKEEATNDGTVCEWFDVPVYPDTKMILEELSECNGTAKIKFIGSNLHDIKTITKTQISDIKRAMDYFQAKGGILH